MVTDRLLLSDEALDCMYPGMRMEQLENSSLQCHSDRLEL